MLWCGLETKQICLIGSQRRQSPRDSLVKSDQQSWTAGYSDAAGIECLAADMKFHPERWITHGRLRIAHEHCRTGRSFASAHHPGMAEFRTVLTRSFVGASGGTELFHPFEPSSGYILPLDNC